MTKIEHLVIKTGLFHWLANNVTGNRANSHILHMIIIII